MTLGFAEDLEPIRFSQRTSFNMALKHRIGLLILILAVTWAARPVHSESLSAQKIMQRAFEVDEANELISREYTFLERVEERKLSKRGDVKGTEAKTFDIIHLYEHPYRRLIERDDEPLPTKEEQREQKKFDKAVEKRRDEGPRQREKRLEEKRKRKEDERKMVAEVVRAFNFSIVGEDTRQGVDAYVIQAEPKASYEPEFKKAKFLKQLQGKIWIAKQDFGWMRVEAETIGDTAFGLSLIKLKKGAELAFEQSRINNEVWMLDRFKLRFAAKVGYVLGLRREVEVMWSDFKKFATESRLIADAVGHEIVGQ